MKITTYFTLPLLLVALASSSTLAADAGPKTGGNLSTNPAGRAPRSESLVVDGGPKTGDASSVNPNSIVDVTTAPPAAEPATATPVTAAPATVAPDAPPKSGGDTSTNPFSRRTTAPPPALTTAAPLTTAPAGMDSATDSPSNSASSDDKTTKTPAPSQSVNGESVDFSLINDDTKSGADDVIGEVSPDHNLDASAASASGSSSNSTSNSDTASDGETANEADLPTTESSGPTAATPSPVSTRNASNSKGISGAVRGGQSSLAAVMAAAMTIVGILSAVAC